MNQICIGLLFSIFAAAVSFANDAGTDQNKAIARKVFTEILTGGNYATTNEIYAQDFVNHHATRDISLLEDQEAVRGWRSAFPDLRMIVEKEIAEGDLVAVFWRAQGTNTGIGNGLNATGKKAAGRGISIFRIVDGRIKEEWTEYSQLLLLQQLGLAGK
jgi:predicted ester cyclase